MALVLRITRFIGTTLKPAWHARCHLSPCAGLGIFSTGIPRLSPCLADITRCHRRLLQAIRRRVLGRNMRASARAAILADRRDGFDGVAGVRWPLGLPGPFPSGVAMRNHARPKRAPPLVAHGWRQERHRERAQLPLHSLTKSRIRWLAA